MRCVSRVRMVQNGEGGNGRGFAVDPVLFAATGTTDYPAYADGRHDMLRSSEIFEKHYKSYCDEIRDLDFNSIYQKLGLDYEDGRIAMPLFDMIYRITKDGIADVSGRVPDYMICVILSKYLLLCPDVPCSDIEWVSFKDFKKSSHLLNVSYFASDTEGAMVKNFSGRLDELSKACERLGGARCEMQLPYDLSMRFDALPRISLLLLFNDRDDEFPAKCSVLFQKQAEHYLDPESLAMTSAVLARKLANSAGIRAIHGDEARRGDDQ